MKIRKILAEIIFVIIILGAVMPTVALAENEINTTNINNTKIIINIIFSTFFRFGFDFILSSNLAIPRINKIPIVKIIVNSIPNRK